MEKNLFQEDMKKIAQILESNQAHIIYQKYRPDIYGIWRIVASMEGKVVMLFWDARYGVAEYSIKDREKVGGYLKRMNPGWLSRLLFKNYEETYEGSMDWKKVGSDSFRKEPQLTSQDIAERFIKLLKG